MTITQLDEKSLDRYFGLSGWKEPVSTEPLPDPTRRLKFHSVRPDFLVALYPIASFVGT
jgi:hypothetical protein